ncbi:TPA: class IV adenylate cyclase [Photobacterium damselae]
MKAEHFKGKFEVELKFRIKSKYDFLNKLKSMTYEVMVEDNQEIDCYFDTYEQFLFTENKSLCIREMEPSGIKLWIVKGPESDRCEATNITDANKAKNMLKTMGYHMFLSITKTRSIYFIDKYHVTVDYLDGIGDFVEFAIMTDDCSLLDAFRTELVSLASKFDLTAYDLEHRSYRQIHSDLITM